MGRHLNLIGWLLRRCQSCRGTGVTHRGEYLLTDAQFARLLAANPWPHPTHGPQPRNTPALVSRRCSTCNGTGRRVSVDG